MTQSAGLVIHAEVFKAKTPPAMDTQCLSVFRDFARWKDVVVS
jgi:hypothetical protein